jgi:hypothetical protein
MSAELDAAKHNPFDGVVAGLVREIIRPRIETTRIKIDNSLAWDHSKR